MNKRFICKHGASLYYLVNEGMGGFLNPPTHPEHSYSIVEYRGGHECGSYSLSAAASEDWLPGSVKGTAKGILKRWQAGTPDSAWVQSVYNYFRHCYSVDGIETNVNHEGKTITFGKFWDNADLEKDMPPTHHLGYMFVKKYYPDHEPDLNLIWNNGPLGSWSTGGEG